MKTFDGGYGRTGTISLEVRPCSICEKTAPCIVIDQSEREYHAGAVCQPCATALFQEQ